MKQLLTITPFGRTLVDDADAATARSTLGLGTAATQASGAFDPAGAAVAAQAASQPVDPTLTALAALTIAANTLTVGTGADAFSQTAFAANTFPARASTGNLEAKTVTDAALSVLDDTTVSAMVDTLGGASSTGTGGLVRATSPTFGTQITTPKVTNTDTLTLTSTAGTKQIYLAQPNDGSSVRIGSSIGLIIRDIAGQGGGIYSTEANPGGLLFSSGTPAPIYPINASGVVNNAVCFGSATYQFANIYSVLGTFSGAVTASANGSASTSAVSLTGTPFAGTGTTSFPLLYLNQTGATASTTLNTAGTFIGVNADTSSPDLMNLMVDGVSKAKITGSGGATFTYNMSLLTTADGYGSAQFGINFVTFGGDTSFGSGYPFIQYNTVQTPDTLMVGLGSLGNTLIICRGYSQYAFDFAHAQQTNPTLYIHSSASSTTEWIGTTHDGTNGVITVGTGSVSIPGSLIIGSGTAVTKVISATATLNFGSIAASASADLTIALTGAAVGDTVSIGVPDGAISGGTNCGNVVFFGWVSATDTVTVRCTNNDPAVAADPASGTFRATIVKF